MLKLKFDDHCSKHLQQCIKDICIFNVLMAFLLGNFVNGNNNLER